MKSTFTRFKISNPLDRLADAIEIVVRVDLSFPHLRIPAWLARMLALNEVGSRDEVVLGAMAMADMDLVVDSETGTVSPNPDNPNIASSVAKYALRFTGGSAERAGARPRSGSPARPPR